MFFDIPNPLSVKPYLVRTCKNRVFSLAVKACGYNKLTLGEHGHRQLNYELYLVAYVVHQAAVMVSGLENTVIFKSLSYI